MTTNLYDLQTAAFEAAKQSIAADQVTTEAARLAAFKTAGFDNADYPLFEQAHNTHLANMRIWKSTPSPATRAATASKAPAPIATPTTAAPIAK